MMFVILRLVLLGGLFAHWPRGALAGTVPLGGFCSNASDHYDPATHKFLSQCTDQTFCASANATCSPRQCRRDEYAFGFPPGAAPLLCPPSTFCPDNGRGCITLVPPGGACELNRDEQCAPPPDWQALASAQNANGSICLHSTCMYANTTLGAPCIIENTTYADVGLDGTPLTTVVARDNCWGPLLYCDAETMLCEYTRTAGMACAADQECETHTCGAARVCTDPPGTPLRVPLWQIIFTGLCIAGAMVVTCMLLTLIHKWHRLEHYKEVREYYTEQMRLRRQIIALHSAAADRYTDEKGMWRQGG